MIQKKSFSQDLQSKVIAFLRLPLIITVLFIHNNGSARLAVSGQIFGADSDTPVFRYCSYLFSGVFGGIAVPLFFFMSGFLFFLNIDRFNLQHYCKKLKTRAKSLLVPYLFWNLAVFAVCYMKQNVPALSNFIDKNKEVCWQNFFSYFYNAPAAYQFWFIRDLMIAVLLTPVIYFLCRRAKIYIVIALGIFLFSGWRFDIIGLSINCLFFFTAGAFFGISKRNLLDDFGRIRNLSFFLYPLLALAELLTKDCTLNHYVHLTGIIIGIVFCFNLAAFLFEKGKIKPAPFLSAASFFVFAVHDPFLLGTFRKVTYMLLQPDSEWILILLYFLNVICVTLASLGLYWILRKFLPKFTALITGGR